MRVGLARHFPVRLPWPQGWITSTALHEWRARYDGAEVDPLPVEDETGRWPLCLASDLPRAAQTAAALHRSPQPQPALREAETAPLPTRGLRLPAGAWRILYRLAWACGHPSQRDLRDGFLARVRQVADLVEAAETDTLLVSHAGTMIYLRRELERRGFQGPRFRVPEHARVYVMQRG